MFQRLRRLNATSMNGISAILFDLDGTLFDHELSEQLAIRAIHRKSDLKHVSVQDFTTQWCLNSTKFYKEFTEGRLSFQDQRTQRVMGVWSSFGRSLNEIAANEIFESYLEHYENEWRAFEDASNCLTILSSRFLLGIITNGNSIQQRSKLRRCNIERFFTHIMISEEVGVSKPNPEIFRIACEHLKTAPGQCIFIGDHYEQDVQGALAAGLKPIWLTRKGFPEPIKYEGQTAQSLRQVIDILMQSNISN